MKKNIFKAILPLVLLFSFGMDASINADAAEEANASTEMSFNVESGGLTVSADKNLDFGTIPLNTQNTAENKVTVVNYTGTNRVNLTGVLKNDLPEGITLESTRDGYLKGPTDGPKDLKGVSNTGQIDGVTIYDFSWRLLVRSTYQGELGLYSNEIIITASPKV